MLNLAKLLADVIGLRTLTPGTAHGGWPWTVVLLYNTKSPSVCHVLRMSLLLKTCTEDHFGLLQSTLILCEAICCFNKISNITKKEELSGPSELGATFCHLLPGSAGVRAGGLQLQNTVSASLPTNSVFAMGLLYWRSTTSHQLAPVGHFSVIS